MASVLFTNTRVSFQNLWKLHRCSCYAWIDLGIILICHHSPAVFSECVESTGKKMESTDHQTSYPRSPKDWPLNVSAAGDREPVNNVSQTVEMTVGGQGFGASRTPVKRMMYMAWVKVARIVDDHHTFKEGGVGGGSYIPSVCFLTGGVILWEKPNVFCLVS